jgi:hypothetical protein
VDYGISNVLQLLMFSDVVTNTGNREYHELYDDRYLQVLIQLRKMGLLKKEDIQRYDLLSYSCDFDIWSNGTRPHYCTPLVMRFTNSLRYIQLFHSKISDCI